MTNPDSNLNQETHTDEHQKIDAIFKGFTVQIEINYSLTNEEQEEYKENILKLVSQCLENPECLKPEYLKDFQLDPQCGLNFNWDPHNSDLLEILASNSSNLSVSEAWEWTYILRRLEGVIYVEPSFALLWLSGTGCIPPGSCDFGGLSREQLDKQIDRISNCEWHLDQMQVRDAWKEFFQNESKNAGKGIIIAHPDTGYFPHPELDVLLNHDDCEKSKDSYSEERPKPPNLQESMESEDFPSILWHGTAVASLMTSPEGQQIKKGDKFVTGVAPGAKVKPFRLGTSSLEYEYFSPKLAQAINEAANEAENDSGKEEKLRVLSISLGGYPTLAVRRAIINAQKQGIIVVAAAGNKVPFVVWPAAYDKVIAVASSSVNLSLAKRSVDNAIATGSTLEETSSKVKIASHSSRGSRVDIAAPGEFVYVAVATKGDKEPDYIVEPRLGTSYAAPLVAGVAAMWLSYHGWDKLVAHYEVPARIPLVFDKLLRKTCYKPRGWDTANWGAGIVNAYRLLKEELPDPYDPYIQEPLAYGEVDHVRLDRGGLESFVHLFEQTLSDPKFLQGISIKILEESILKKLILELKTVEESSLAQAIRSAPTQWVLEQFLGQSGKDLRQFLRTFGQEIIFHLGTDLTLYRQVENALKRTVGLPVDNTDDDLRNALAALKKIASKYLSDQL